MTAGGCFEATPTTRTTHATLGARVPPGVTKRINQVYILSSISYTREFYGIVFHQHT